MKNYVLIYHIGASFPETEEFNAAWMAWTEMLGANLVDGGNPFNGDFEAQVKNGEVTMKADTAAGYTIVKAETIEAAVAFAKECPMAKMPTTWVNVYETMSM